MATARRLAANFLAGIFANVGRVGIQVAMLPIIARLLGPEELGLYALALPIIDFALYLCDFGLGDSLARDKSKGKLVWSSAFWALLFSGTTLAAIAYGASFYIGDMAHQPRLPEIMLPLCVTLLMICASVVPAAQMLREGNIVPASFGDVLGSLSAAAVAIYMAKSGFGVWAMVAQFVTIYLVRMIVLNVARPFLPSFEFSLKALFRHSGMGGAILVTRLSDLLARMFEDAQVSRQLGPKALGNYSYAAQIGSFASNSVGSVLWANLYYVSLSHARNEVIAHFLRTHRIFALIVFPGATLLALSVPTVIPMFFGPRWTEAIVPIMIMVLTYPLYNLGNFQTAVLFTRNRSLIVLIGQFIYIGLRVLTVLFAYEYGVTGLVLGLAGCNLMLYTYALLIGAPIIGVRRRKVVGAVAQPLFASVFVGIFAYVMMGTAPTLSWLASVWAMSGGLYLLILLVIDFRGVVTDLAGIKGLLTNKVDIAGEMS